MENEYKYEIGEVIHLKNSSYRILDKFTKETKISKHEKFYLCQCLKDDYVFEKSQTNIGRTGCPLCSHNVVALGYNTIYDLRPDLIKYLADPEDAKKYTPYSNKKIWCVCPYCGYKKLMPICNLVIQGFACQICSDNISYPNKFIRAFLNQLNIDYIPEKSFDWLPNRKYDQYIPKFNMIIENHGEQHYISKKGWGNCDQEIDKQKKEQALANGISNYIEIDCRKSNSEYIINSIMDSSLPLILSFDYSDIDWVECERIASGSLVHEVCNMWNNHSTYKEIEDKLRISKDTIRTYIRRGYKIGLTKELRHYDSLYSGSHPIYCITDNIYFFSVTVAADYYSNEDVMYYPKRIGVDARDRKIYKGKEFKYITRKEFNKAKNLSLTDASYIVYGDLYSERAILKEENTVLD